MSKRAFNRSSWLVLGFVFVMLAVDLGQVAYRALQPTDGWFIWIEPTTAPFNYNALGADSPIHSRDNLIAVEGLDIAAASSNLLFVDLRPVNWQSGQTVTYRILRAGKELDLEVPLYHWSASSLLKQVATPFWLISLLLFGLGGFVFSRQPLDWGARSLFLFSASLFSTSLSGMVNQAVDMLLPSRVLTIFFSYLIFGWLMFPSFLMLALSFPRPKLFVQRHPLWIVLGVYGVTPLIVLLTGNLGIGWLTVIGFALLSLAAVVHSSFAIKDTVGRAQIRWAVTGVVTGAISFTINNVLAIYFATNPVDINLPGYVMDLPFIFGFTSIALGFAIAILRYRLFDIDVIIRRTLVYSLLTALLALVYFGAVTVLQNLFQAASGQTSTAAIVISTLGIATLFNPLRRRLQEIIDRRFYRQKYNAEQALADFAATARSQTDIQQLSTELAGLTQETLHPQQVTIWLRKVERQ